MKRIRDAEAAKQQREKERQEQLERVYSWIDHGDKKNVLANWEMSKDVLLYELFSLHTRTNFVDGRAVRAAEALVKLGREELIQDLVNLLNRGEHTFDIAGVSNAHARQFYSPDRTERERLAEVYLNCGHKRLAEAAEDWARHHGYLVKRSSGSPRVGWGAT